MAVGNGICACSLFFFLWAGMSPLSRAVGAVGSPTFGNRFNGNWGFRTFSPSIDVERVGIGVEWRKGLQVMFRLRGSERPR